MPDFTSQQEDLIEEMQTSEESILCESYAGTGKSTTLAAGATGLPSLYLAFSKRDKEDAMQKFPENTTVRNYNGFGHRIIMQHLGHKISLNQDKNLLIAKDKLKLPKEEQWDAAKLLSLLKGNAVSTDEIEDDTVWPLVERHDLEVSNPTAVALYGLRESMRMFDQDNLIDFDDQLYLPIIRKMRVPRYPVVFADEFQDTNLIQYMLLKRACIDRIIAVGDSHQAIYGFRGAGGAPSMFLELYNPLLKKLSVSFRCPKAVVEEARDFVSDFEAHPDNSIGSVTDLGCNWKPEDTPKGAVYLCRNNGPLFRLAFRFLNQGVVVNFMGRDFGRGLIALLRKLHGDNKNQLVLSVEDWRTMMENKWLAKGKKEKASAVNEKAESLQNILELCRGTTKDEILNDMKEIFFTSKTSNVTLSTIHRAKGREWPTVFWLDPHLVGARAKTPEQMQQEDNLAYVCLTRAKENLIKITTQKDV